MSAFHLFMTQVTSTSPCNKGIATVLIVNTFVRQIDGHRHLKGMFKILFLHLVLSSVCIRLSVSLFLGEYV